MTTKKTAKTYKYVGNYPRGENGKTVKYGDLVNLDHLKADVIKTLIRMGYYQEVK